jgi:hypothetical protein
MSSIASDDHDSMRPFRPFAHFARRAALIGVAAGAVSAGCAPRAGSLRGTPVPARFPRVELPPGHQRLVFRWEYTDQALGARGEGVARIAAPDSVRLDLFLDGGLGGGYAIVIGDSVATPGGDQVRRFLPPVSLLWAALGRLAVPPSPDTVAKVDGDALRADIGRNPAWRVTFTGDRLGRLERIVDGRRVEWVSRTGSDVRYENERASRSLRLRITATDEASPFDPAIWRR